MKNLKAQLELGLLGNIPSQCSKFSSSFAGLAASGRQNLAALGNYAAKTEDVLGKVYNRTTGILGSIGMGISGKYAADMQTRIEALGIVADRSSEEMAALNDQIYKTAQDRDINIDPSELLAAIEKISAKTGDLDFGIENMKNLAYTISATASAGEDIGALAGDLFEKFGIRDAQSIISTLGLLANQGKMGAFELKDLATQGERVTAAYAMMGRKGPNAVAEMGALLQMAKKGTGSAEQAATAFEAVIRNLTDKDKLEALEAAGIKVRNVNGEFRSAVDIIKDIIIRTKGDATMLGSVFDTFAIRGVSVMATGYAELRKEGKSIEDSFKMINEFQKANRDGQVVINDSIRMANTFNSAVTSLRAALSQKVFSELTPYLQDLTSAINSTSPEQIQQYLELGKKVFIGLGSVWLGAKALRMGNGLLGMLGGKSAAGNIIGGLAGATMGNPIPVFVVNSGDAKLSGYSSRFKRRPNVGAGAALEGSVGGALLRNSARLLGRLGAAGAVGYGVYEAFTADNAQEMGKGIGTSIGGAIGMLGGPIGVAVGSVVGRYLGGYIGEKVGKFQEASTMEEKNKIIGKGLGEITGLAFGGFGASRLMGAWNETAMSYIGRMIDRLRSADERKAKEAEAKRPITQTAVYFKIDKDGNAQAYTKSQETTQSYMDIDSGYTRLYSNEA
jgi:hypothetical protein|nr:MAG TPA: minor tail protein [Caudoviricetes sp.]